MRLTKILASSAAFTVAVAIATSAVAAPPTPPTPPVTVPAPACYPSSQLSILLGLPSLGPVGDGRRAYLANNCAGCHGGNGAGGMGPNVQQASATLVNTFLANGSPYGMISYSHCLTQNDANNLAAYLASVGTAAEPTWSDWWNAAP